MLQRASNFRSYRIYENVEINVKITTIKFRGNVLREKVGISRSLRPRVFLLLSFYPLDSKPKLGKPRLCKRPLPGRGEGRVGLLANSGNSCFYCPPTERSRVETIGAWRLFFTVERCRGELMREKHTRHQSVKYTFFRDWPCFSKRRLDDGYTFDFVESARMRIDRVER